MSADKTVEVLLIFCDALDNATATLRNNLKELKKQENSQPKNPEISEDVFIAFKWNPETGQKLGSYEVALIQDNNKTDWQETYDFLKQQNATISNRYHCKKYTFSYWLYEKSEYKIYRQKLKDSSK